MWIAGASKTSWDEGVIESAAAAVSQTKGDGISILAQSQAKISFRSKDDFDVNRFAREYFNGGGHINAAGGFSKESLKDTILKFENLLPKYKVELSRWEF